MIALALLVALVVAVVVAARSHAHPAVVAVDAPVGRPATESPIGRKLGEWRAAGLLDDAAATAILDYEVARARPRSRIPMAAEAVGYVGSALVFAAIVLIVSQQWEDLGSGARVAVLLGPALVAGGAGWIVGRIADPAFERMGSVLWLLAVGGWAGAATVGYVDGLHDGEPPANGGLLTVSAVVAVVAAALYVLRRLPLQLLVTYASSVLVALGVVELTQGDRVDERAFSSVPWGAAVLAIGLVWWALGWFGPVTPVEVGRLVGPATVLVGAQVIRADAPALGIWIGLVLTAAIVAVGVRRGDPLTLLLGTAGLFQWTPQLALHYFSDSLGPEVTLLIVGLLLLAVAGVFVRVVRRLPDRRPDVGAPA